MNERGVEDVEALARHFSAREPSLPLRQDCPDPAELYEAAAGRLQEQQRLRIVDHLTVCAECARAWRLATELQPARAPASRARLWERPMGMLAAAACLVVAAGAVWFLVVPGGEQAPPGYRTGSDLGAPESRLEQTVMPRSEFRLRWSSGPPGATYTLRLTDAALNPVLVETELAATELVVPPAALDGVAAGSRLFWQVEMELPTGERAVSPTYSIVLR